MSKSSRWLQSVTGLLVSLPLIYGIHEDILKSEKRNDNQAQAQDLVRVTINVLEVDTSRPIPRVPYLLTGKGAPVKRVTDDNGYSEISIPTRTSVELYFEHKCYKNRREIIDLEVDPSTTRPIYLEPKQPPPSDCQTNSSAETSNPPESNKIDWGNFRDYFEVEGVGLDPNGRVSERLKFIVTAKGDFSSIPFKAQAYDSEGIKKPIRKLNFIPNEASWEAGERARVWVDLPYEFSKVEILE